VQELCLPESKLHLIPFHADHRFYRPIQAEENSPQRMICSAGLEWRDYPTLIEAVRGMDVEVRLAAASPWSKHRNETADRQLPPNVSARRYEYRELRQLYAESRFVVAPLYDNDFQAGITTILEAMAMGRAVIATRTAGQIDTIEDGLNGLYVPPGDVAGWRSAIRRLLESPREAAKLGTKAREDIEERMTLGHWVDRISGIICDVAAARSASVCR
jgi:glycosyltransferase involved in cell wall biosynthesis